MSGLFPVYLFKGGRKYPAQGNYFIVASNGPFVRKYLYGGLFDGLIPCSLKDVPGAVEVGYSVETPEGRVFVRETKYKTKVDNSWKWKEPSDEVTNLTLVDAEGKNAEDNLDPVEPYIRFRLPKLPLEMVYKTLLFFRKINRKYNSEAIVVLGFDKEKQEYKLFCPKQNVSAAHIDYNRDFAKYISAPYKPVGTIHSHPTFNAYHSGVDTGDEQSFDGVHLTFGHVDDESFSIASSLVLGAGGDKDHREVVEPENVALGIKRVGNSKASRSFYMSSDLHNYYNIDAPAEQLKELKKQFDAEIEKEWMPLVGRQQFRSGYSGGYNSFGGTVVAGEGIKRDEKLWDQGGDRDTPPDTDDALWAL